MTKTPLLALYSLAHFWVDLSCALLAFRTLSASPDFALCLLLYNFCAFALQMPPGAPGGPAGPERGGGRRRLRPGGPWPTPSPCPWRLLSRRGWATPCST